MKNRGVCHYTWCLGEIEVYSACGLEHAQLWLFWCGGKGG